MLEFDGERFLPECVGEIWSEHWHRYVFAAQLVAGGRVLDIACGEGYGSDLLSRVADSVVGVDISPEAVDHATRRYGAKPDLTFVVGSCDAIPLADACLDAVVSFETIEHVATQTEMLDEITRILKPGGRLVLSCPNKLEYSDKRGYRNPFHVKELYLEELKALLAARFPRVRWYLQNLLVGSAVWPVEDALPTFSATVWSEAREPSRGGFPVPGMYFLAVCDLAAPADDAPPDPHASLLLDSENSLYTNYQENGRELLRRGELIAERDRLLESRNREFAIHEKLIARLEDHLREAGRLATQHQQLLESQSRTIEQQTAMIAGQGEELERRRALLATQSDELERQQRALERQQGDLDEHARVLQQQQVALEEQARALEQQQAELLAKEGTLRSQAEALRQQEEHSADQAALVRELQQQVREMVSVGWWLRRPFSVFRWVRRKLAGPPA